MRYLFLIFLFLVFKLPLLDASNFVINGTVPLLSIDDVEQEGRPQLLEVIDESQSYSLQVDRKSKGKITVQLQTPLNSNLKLKVELESLKGARNHGIVDISDGRVHELVTNIKEGQYLDCYIKYYFSGSFDAEVFPPTSYGINYLYKSKEL